MQWNIGWKVLNIYIVARGSVSDIACSLQCTPDTMTVSKHVINFLRKKVFRSSFLQIVQKTETKDIGRGFLSLHSMHGIDCCVSDI